MKKNIIILGLISLLAVSCGDDFLTTHPGDSVSTDLALSTEQDIDNAVNGLYDLMSSYGYYGGTLGRDVCSGRSHQYAGRRIYLERCGQGRL